MALIDPELLQMLACPSDHAPLEEIAPATPDGGDEGALRCRSCGALYPIREGIPVLLDEAETR